jgi:hypothetical protein
MRRLLATLVVPALISVPLSAGIIASSTFGGGSADGWGQLYGPNTDFTYGNGYLHVIDLEGHDTISYFSAPGEFLLGAEGGLLAFDLRFDKVNPSNDWSPAPGYTINDIVLKPTSLDAPLFIYFLGTAEADYPVSGGPFSHYEISLGAGLHGLGPGLPGLGQWYRTIDPLVVNYRSNCIGRPDLCQPATDAELSSAWQNGLNALYIRSEFYNGAGDTADLDNVVLYDSQGKSGAEVPEPGTLGAMGLALLAMWTIRRR